jgi:hypothetical protein
MAWISTARSLSPSSAPYDPKPSQSDTSGEISFLPRRSGTESKIATISDLIAHRTLPATRGVGPRPTAFDVRRRRDSSAGLKKWRPLSSYRAAGAALVSAVESHLMDRFIGVTALLAEPCAGTDDCP